ncbi:MAG TPA: cytochrome c oxidase assembly protein [Beijerinckiaceae bacterium]
MRPLLVIIVCLAAREALAHTGEVHWFEFASTWTWDAWIVVPLAASVALYAVGITRLWRRAGIGRGVRLWQAACFAAAWLLLVAALVAPLHWLGERLFTAHMVEHEILMVLAAPLLVVARPIGAILWALPTTWRRASGAAAQRRPLAAVWRWLTDPLVATILHGVALWMWHIPVLYEAALASGRLHWLQHVSFFATALLFWWSLLRGRARERGYGAAVIYLFATSLHSGFLGILLALARQPLYPAQTGAAFQWGLTPLEDQQLAGLIMWVPAGLVYAAAALALAGLWIARSGTAARRGGAHALVG